jgi:RNA polymerase sigma factor (sigma-70 family)
MRKVLVVDDEQAITDGLVAMFGLEAIEADGAYDRESAEELLSSQYYPVILADLRLKSEAEGLMLLESIRRISPRTRIATLTGFATPEMEEKLRSLGSSTILHKPLEAERIVAIVSEMLEAIELEIPSGEDGLSQPPDLDALYQRVRPILYAIPQRRYGFSSEEAEDLVQEAWCLFLEKQRNVEKPQPWLAGTVTNLCRQQIQQRVRSRPSGGENEDRSADTTEEWSALFDSMMIREGLGRIDERSRQLCVLIGIEGRSYEEVSEELGLPIGSVGPLYIRSKQKLRRALGSIH